MNKDRLSIAAVFDRELVLDRGNSVRYLVVDVSTRARNRDEDPSGRPPLNVAIVIDASTSMKGEPMSAARHAARGVIASLNERDRISIVSFAQDVKVHAAGLRLDKFGRNAAQLALESIEHRLYTDIGGGWLKGAECVARVMESETERYHNCVLLMSDGHANHGILDPLVLQNHAEQLRLRGVSTSTLGIGDHYTASLLQGMAEQGGGRMHDAQYASEIVSVVMGELNELKDTYVEDLSLQLRFAEGVQVENISGFPTTMASNSLLCNLGSLPSQSSKTVVFRVKPGSGKAGNSMEFHANVKGKLPGKEQHCHTKDAVLSLEFAGESKNRMQERDERVTMKVARVWQASVVRHAVELNRRGEIRELKRYLEHEIKFLSRFACDIPAAGFLVGELNQLRKNADKVWHERLRKEMQVSTYQYLTTTGDFRPLKREHWSTSFLNDDD